MRRYMSVSRIIIILSLINIARAAPVAVREVYEVHVNEVDVAEHGTATSEKRWDSGPRHDWLSAPTAQQLPDLNDSGLHRPRSSTRSDNAPSSSALSTGSHPRSKDDTPPSSGSPVYSPIPWVPDQSVTSSPEYSQPSWLSTDYSPSADSYHLSSPDYSPISTDNSVQSSSPTGPHQPTGGHPLSSSEPPRPTEPETKGFLSQLLINPSRDPPSPAPPPYHWSPPSKLLTDSPPPLYWSPPSASSSPEPVDSPPTGHSPAPPPHHWSPPSKLLTDSPPPLYWSPPSASSSPEPVDSPPTGHSPAPPPYHWSPTSILLKNPPPLYWSPPSASSSPEPGDTPPIDHSPVPPPYHWSPPSTLLKNPPPPLYWSPPSASSSPEPVDSPPTGHSPVPPPNPEPSPANPVESVSKSELEDLLDNLFKGSPHTPPFLPLSPRSPPLNTKHSL